MALLDFLRGQQAQQPGAMQQQGGGLMGLLDPSVALPAAAALLGNQGNSANFGNAFGAMGEGMAQQRELQAQTAQKNKTLEFLRQNSPELAAAVEGGMPVNEAWGSYMDSRKAQAAKNPFQDRATAAQQYGLDPNSAEGRRFILSGDLPSGGADDYAQRQRAAEQYGLTPEDPRYQSFLLTGKMPREDAQPLTATDKKAILEADEMVQVSDSALPLIERALQLNDKAYSGMLAGPRGYITGNMGSDAGLATIEYDNLVQQQALNTLKSTFGAAPTEGERKILLEVAGSSNQPPEVRKGILERAKAAVTRRQQFYRDRAAEMRGGTFYKQGGGTSAPAGQPQAGATGGVVNYTDYFGGQ